MDDGYITAIAALVGTVVGSVSSFGTSYFTHRSQRVLDRTVKEASKRETLYGDFLEEASRVIIAAIRSETDDPIMIISITALLSRMRLFASDDVLNAAENVIGAIMAMNVAPSRTLRDYGPESGRAELKPLADFADACRHELHAMA